MATKTKKQPLPVQSVAPPTGLSTVVGRTEDEGYFLIDLSDLVPSPTNHRKEFDEAKLTELADSLRSKGVLQPLVVRPHQQTKDRYEIVAGERRYRAGKLAKMKELPCIIRNLSDRDVVEIQCIENDQRADVTDMERARAYQQLVDSGVSVGEMAAKLGRSPSAIRDDLLLNRCPEKLAKAVADGRVSKTVAILIARVPGERQRSEAAECVLLGCTPRDLDYCRTFPNPPLNKEDAKNLIADYYTRELKNSPFNANDKLLLPEAGGCKTCPKRSGNNRDEYPDGRADMCNDVACFANKVEANKEWLRADARSKGFNVATEEELKEIYPYFGAIPAPAWVDLDHMCEESPKGETWRQLYVRSEPLKALVMLAFDHNGFPRYLAKRTRLLNHLYAEGVLERPEPKPKPERASEPPPESVDESKPRLIDTIDLDVEEEESQLTKEADIAFRAAFQICERHNKTDNAGMSNDMWQLLGELVGVQVIAYCEAIVDGEAVVCEMLTEVRGLIGSDFRKAVLEWSRSACVAELFSVWAAITVQNCDDMHLPYDSRKLIEFAKPFVKDGV